MNRRERAVPPRGLAEQSEPSLSLDQRQATRRGRHARSGRRRTPPPRCPRVGSAAHESRTSIVAGGHRLPSIRNAMALMRSAASTTAGKRSAPSVRRQSGSGRCAACLRAQLSGALQQRHGIGEADRERAAQLVFPDGSEVEADDHGRDFNRGSTDRQVRCCRRSRFEPRRSRRSPAQCQ